MHPVGKGTRHHPSCRPLREATFFACLGKVPETFWRLSKGLVAHAGDISLTVGRPNAFASGCMLYFPHAYIIYGRVYIAQAKLGEVHMSEADEKKLPNGHRVLFFLLRKNLLGKNNKSQPRCCQHIPHLARPIVLWRDW